MDAGLLLGLTGKGSGQWCIETLKVKEAQKYATGKGVTVAILDHLFDPMDESLKNRMVKPGSVVSEPICGLQGHGTWMANDLVKVAPGVKIMPVRIRCRKERGADYYIKGIDYAVKNGADIISLSHRAVSKERQADLDKAIARASQKGVTFVYIHYYSTRKDVIVPGPVEFAAWDKGKDMVFVIGTNFIDSHSFPYTWGLSPTAPLVSGVIAMMKELKPELKPLDIKKILLNSTDTTPDGYPILNALKAVQQVKKSI
jgi:subtilisin family serine protease